MSANPNTSSGRLSDRTRTFLAAQVSYGNGTTLLGCTLRNISKSGARLQISSAVPLPDEFELFIPQRKARLRVHLCWRSEDYCGVSFLDDRNVLSHAEKRASAKDGRVSDLVEIPWRRAPSM